MPRYYSIDGKGGPPLIVRLLDRGDRIEIDRGRLTVTPMSGLPVPDDWLLKNSIHLVREIAVQCQKDIYQYQSFSTGSYRKARDSEPTLCKSGYSGLTLQLTNLRTAENYHAIFNAEITRARTTKHGKAGTPLPGKQFRITKNHDFYKFWITTGLPIPRRRSSYHDFMGHLSGVFFDGQIHHKKETRLMSSSLHPTAITYIEILTAFGIPAPDNHQTIPRQNPDNFQTRMPDKESPESQINRGLEPISTTGKNNHGIGNQGSEVLKEDNTSLNSRLHPKDQTREQWWADYDSPTSEPGIH